MGSIGDLSGSNEQREELTFTYFANCDRQHPCQDRDCEDNDDDEAGAPRHTHECRGREMRVAPDATDLHWTAFLARAGEMPDDITAPDAVRESRDYVRQQIHPDDWDDFWWVSVAHGRTTEQLLGVAQAIVEAITGFPTQQPSGSSDGRANNTDSSREGLSRQARRQADREDDRKRKRRIRAVRETIKDFGEKIVDGEKLPARGDLQLSLLRKAQHDGVLPPEWIDSLPDLSVPSAI